MRRSASKNRIIETATRLINERGYAGVKVNDIAYLANVSVGNLYYHFPNGKASILTEIMSKLTEGYHADFQEKMRAEGIPELEQGFDEALEWLLLSVIEARRKDRRFHAAVHSEMLSDLDRYMEVVEEYESDAAFMKGFEAFLGLLGQMSERFREEGLVLEGNESKVIRVLGLLLSHQIYIPCYFGSDEEFVGLLKKVLRTLLS